MRWKIIDRFEGKTKEYTPFGYVHWNTIETDNLDIMNYFKNLGHQVDGHDRYVIEVIDG